MSGDSRQIWSILLVDNDEDDYFITRSMLSKLQGRTIHLQWASSYAMAQDVLRSEHYDAVLVDYDLGPRTGLELIREAVSLGYPAPMILYTSRGNYDMDVEAMQAGATMYMTKAEATPLLMERFLRYAIERKWHQEELNRRHEERLEILESIQDGFFSIDRNWNFRYANHRAALGDGKQPEDLIGKNLWETYPRLIGTEYETNYRSVMEERKARHFEVRSIYTNYWYSISVYPSLDGISIFWLDISERKRLEEEIRSLALFSEENVNPVMRLSADGRLIYANPAAQSIGWGECAGESLSLPAALTQAALASLQEETAEAPTQAAAQAAAKEVEIACSDRTFLFTVLPIVDKGYINLYGVDVTRRKLAETLLVQRNAALEESEARFRAMADGTPLIIWVTDAQGRLEFINRAYQEYFGITSGASLPVGWQSLVHPDDHARYIDVFADSLQQQSVYNATGRVLRCDGQWRWIESFGQPRFSPSGEFLGLAGSSIDITDRIQPGQG